MTSMRIPSDAEFLHEALQFLAICKSDCSCPDHWHFLWAGLKAAGLRRGVYRQAAQFEEALRGHLRPGSSIFIAGAADAGTLTVLHSVAAAVPVAFTVMDRCRAPLRMVDAYARQQGIALQTHLGDVTQVQGDAHWDVILIHNTLILMDAEARTHALADLAGRLNPGGLILSQVRYNAPTDARDEAALAAEEAALAARFAHTFRDHPDAVALLAPRIGAFVRSQQSSLSARPSRAQLEAEIRAAGLEMVAALPEAGLLPTMVSGNNAALQTQAELQVLRRR